MFEYCPLCDIRHDVVKQVLKERVTVHGMPVEVDQESFYCKKKQESFMNGRMVNNNLARARMVYFKKKQQKDTGARLERHFYKALSKEMNTWVCGDLVKTTCLYPMRTETICRIQEYNCGYKPSETIEFEPDWQSGLDEEVIPETVCQYTGFNDQRGEKIYENDILVVSKSDNGKMKTFHCVCVLRDGMYILLNLTNEKFDTLAYYCGSAKENHLILEVVGNLFDVNGTLPDISQ